MTSSGVCQAHSCELVCVRSKGCWCTQQLQVCLSCRPAEVLCKVFANLSLLSCDYFLLFLLTGHSCLSLSLSLFIFPQSFSAVLFSFSSCRAAAKAERRRWQSALARASHSVGRAAIPMGLMLLITFLSRCTK